MSHRRTHTHSQHSYVVSIDAGSFANIEIVVGGYHRGGVWSPPPRASTTTTREDHSYAHPSSSAKHSSFVHLQSRLPPTSTTRSSSTATDARSKRPSEREQQKHHRLAEERRREEARRAEAHRIATEEARRRTQQRRQEEEKLREEQRRRQERTRRRAREVASTWRTFERIPWPVVADAPLLDSGTSRKHPEALLRHEAIREFLLSSAHSPDVSPKDRIRAGLRRWHPDKFARVLSQVIESDRDAVAEGMGIVVRCLNDMLEKENQS